MKKLSTVIEFGNVGIFERRGRRFDSGYLAGYEIFINGTSRRTVYCNNVDLVILYAMQVKHIGINSEFSTFAAKMLDMDDEIWV
jgi:hypothetical protein